MQQILFAHSPAGSSRAQFELNAHRPSHLLPQALLLHKAGAQASKVCFGTGKSLFKSKCGRTERAQSASCQHSAAPAHPTSQPSSAPKGGENTCPNPLNDPENLGVVIFQTKTQGKRFSSQRGLAELLSSLRLVALCSQHRKHLE